MQIVILTQMDQLVAAYKHIQASSHSNDSNDSRDSPAASGNIVFTSRTSVNKFCSVVSQFSKFKIKLADETGYGGMLQLKILY